MAMLRDPYRIPARDYTNPTLGIGNIRGPQGYAPGYLGGFDEGNFDYTKWLEELEKWKRRPTSAFHNAYGMIRDLGTTYKGRKFVGTGLAMGLAGGAASGAFGGAGAGAGAGAGGAGAGAGAGMEAAGWIDPFVAGGGLGAGGAAAGAGAGAGFSEAAGWIDPFVAGGGLGAAGPVTAGTMPWWKTSGGRFAIYEGLNTISEYLKAREQRKQAERLQEALERQRAETLGFASPEAYLQNYQRYLTEFKGAYRPWLASEQDRAAIGEQSAMQLFDTDVARRGLSGSGLALAGRSAIRTGRQAQIGENMRRYWQMSEEAARDAAQQTRAAQISASTGAPYTYVPRQSTTTAAVLGLGDAYRDWLWLQGTQNNPFVSKKDERYYR